jgi:elongation factor 1 alpha-like protein
MQLAPPKRQHAECRHTLEQVQQSVTSQKHRLNLVIVGHVDAGKSTLMGHLLTLCGRLPRTQLTKIAQEARAAGKAEERFAWVMAEDKSEREHGVTIDVAMVEFETEHLQITVLDAPGHVDFVPTMIAGASQADAALLVIDATNPLITKGQAREHLLLCRALGVGALLVVVNKMDMVGYEERVFAGVVEPLTAFLRSVGWAAIHIIPASAATGENLTTPCPQLGWYAGPRVLDAIDALRPPPFDVAAPFVLCVSASETTDKAVVVGGKIEAGFVCKNDFVKLVPADLMPRVVGVKVNGRQVPFATAGVIAELTLGIGAVTVSIGAAVMAPERPMSVSSHFKARISTFAMEVILLVGARHVFHRHAVDVDMEVVRICNLVNKKTNTPIPGPAYGVLGNSRADVIYRLSMSVPMQPDGLSKSFSRFIIRAQGKTLGFGSISEVLNEDGSPMT